MPDSQPSSVLVVAAEGDLPEDARIWGTGGWIEPCQREALDWLTLGRLLGWDVMVGRERNGNIEADFSTPYRWIIVACDPGRLTEQSVASLASLLERNPVLLLARAGAPGTPLARLAGVALGTGSIAGRNLLWTGPGDERHWHLRRELQGHALEISPHVAVWASLERSPLITAQRKGQSTVATLAFHPSEARDSDGAASALLKHLLIWGTPPPVAWLDFEGTMVLRMDDPGSSENVHHHIYSHTKLDEAAWAAVGEELRRHRARLSIGYVSGWVDDGDGARGELRVAGERVPRIDGRIHPSPQVRYRDPSGLVHDYESEYRGIQTLRAAGLAEVELHGYTHIHPDRDEWLRAPDRHLAKSWFRELGRKAEPILATLPPSEHPLTRGIEVIQTFFQTIPTTLICPGEEFTNPAIEVALRLGLQLVGSYYLAIRDHDRFCWTQHVCAPYLNEQNSSWFDAQLPVVGYFHDFDLRRNNLEWFGECLDQWTRSGATRFITYGDLAEALSRRISIEEVCGELRLTVGGEPIPALAQRFPIGIRVTGTCPSHLRAAINGGSVLLDVKSLGNGLGRALVPPRVILSGREPIDSL